MKPNSVGSPSHKRLGKTRQRRKRDCDLLRMGSNVVSSNAPSVESGYSVQPVRWIVLYRTGRGEIANCLSRLRIQINLIRREYKTMGILDITNFVLDDPRSYESIGYARGSHCQTADTGRVAIVHDPQKGIGILRNPCQQRGTAAGRW